MVNKGRKRSERREREKERKEREEKKAEEEQRTKEREEKKAEEEKESEHLKILEKRSIYFQDHAPSRVNIKDIKDKEDEYTKERMQWCEKAFLEFITDKKPTSKREEIINRILKTVADNGFKGNNISLRCFFYVKLFGWCLMTEEALKKMENFIGDKFCRSVGSGTGWIESLLNCDIECVDISEEKREKAFVPILSESSEKPANTLILCWPPANSHENSSMASDALKAHTGDQLIYIGEGHLGCTGNDEFINMIFGSSPYDDIEISAQWEIVEAISLPQWPDINDNLYLFKRI